MAVAPSSLTGALMERYTLERELGRGGMATVYLAEDLKLHRRVAIKVLHAELAQALGPKRFLHEIDIVARLKHPHILPLYDSGEAGGLLYYVMPHVAGESLRSRLAREKQLPLEQAVQIANQIASALAYAHGQGVVHRDIKPENILLEYDQAVLADFGIARAITAAGGERLTETGLALGTPAYMSPEQGAGERQLDARSDIYSLGCVMYEMLAGEPPFTGPTAQAIIAKRFAGSVPRIRVVREEIPDAVDRAIARSLAKAPADRFADASQFAMALTSALHPPVDLSQTSEATVGGLARRWPSKRWISQRLTKVAIGGALVMLAGVGGALWMRRKPPPALDPNLVAVAPFDVFDAKLALWREGLVDVLSANLDGAGPLRAVSPTVVVRRWRGRADQSSAMDLGRRTGASLAVFGQLMGASRDSVRLRATLLDVARGRMVGEFEERAPTASMDRLTDSLTVALFRELGRSKPIGAVRFAGLGSTSLPALKAFLQGEQFYRRSAWDSAVAHYEQAVGLDSTFAFALYHQSKALKWGAHVGDSPDRSLAAGLRAGALNRGLAPRESLLIAADSLWSAIYSDVFSDDEVDTVAVATLRSRLFATLEQGTRRYPEDPEIWFELGDARFHLGWRVSMAAQQALAAFDKAIALDSAFAPSYLHAADLASYLGDAARLRRYVAGPSDLSPLGEDSPGLIGRLLDPDRAESAETEHVLRSASVDALGEAWGLLQTLRDSAEVGLRVARLLAAREGTSASLAGDSVVRRRSLAATLAYRGHLREAYQHVGREDSGFFFSLFGELALLGGVPRDTAAALFDRWLHRKPFWPAEGFNGLVTALPWWAARGDTLSLRAFMHRADSAIQSSTYVKDMSPGDPRYAAAAARAYLAVARRDTAEAVRRLAAIPLRWCGYCWLERLTYARLLEATGRHGDAFALLDPGFPQRHAYPIRPVWTLELARVAEQLGKSEKAMESYRFITEVWRNADPELQSFVAEAHAALSRYAREESR